MPYVDYFDDIFQVAIPSVHAGKFGTKSGVVVRKPSATTLDFPNGQRRKHRGERPYLFPLAAAQLHSTTR